MTTVSVSKLCSWKIKSTGMHGTIGKGWRPYLSWFAIRRGKSICDDASRRLSVMTIDYHSISLTTNHSPLTWPQLGPSSCYCCHQWILQVKHVMFFLAQVWTSSSVLHGTSGKEWRPYLSWFAIRRGKSICDDAPRRASVMTIDYHSRPISLTTNHSPFTWPELGPSSAIVATNG